MASRSARSAALPSQKSECSDPRSRNVPRSQSSPPPAGAPFLFVARGLVDARSEFVDAFGRQLHPESQAVRGVAMPACPSAFAGIRLDEIRQGHTQFDLRVAERCEFVLRPRQRCSFMSRVFAAALPSR